MKYTFGTTEAAARRLGTIAAMFNPFAAKLISQYVASPVSTALDLGCGPGFTTEMLAETLPGAETWGMDKSEEFLMMARRRCPHLQFIQHDVTHTPFPIRPDVTYARFLLSHLPGVVDLVNRWANELRPGGLLFIDELERIDTEVETFKRYLRINDRLVASQGANLFVGRILAEGSYGHDVLLNRRVTLPVTNVMAATWFYPNAVTIWETEDHVLQNVPARERERIAHELARIRDAGGDARDIVWYMRQLVIKG